MHRIVMHRKLKRYMSNNSVNGPKRQWLKWYTYRYTHIYIYYIYTVYIEIYPAGEVRIEKMDLNSNLEMVTLYLTCNIKV